MAFSCSAQRSLDLVPPRGNGQSWYTATPCRSGSLHGAPFRRLQEALNSSHQLVKLLLDQDLLPPSPFSWPCWGHGADTRNPTYVPMPFPRAAGTSVRRVEAAEWLGRAVIHHLTIFFVGSGEPVRRRESEGKFYLRQSVAFEPDIIRFDRPSAVLVPNAVTKNHQPPQGLLPSSRTTTRFWRRREH